MNTLRYQSIYINLYSAPGYAALKAECARGTRSLGIQRCWVHSGFPAEAKSDLPGWFSKSRMAS